MKGEPMGDCMNFPDTVDEYMEQYKMTDVRQVYSNGIEYVPIFRMKQWFEHEKDQPTIQPEPQWIPVERELPEEKWACAGMRYKRWNLHSQKRNLVRKAYILGARQ